MTATRAPAVPAVGQAPPVRLPTAVREAYAQGWIESAQWMLIPSGRRGRADIDLAEAASGPPEVQEPVREVPRAAPPASTTPHKSKVALRMGRRQLLLTGLLCAWVVVAVVFAALAS